MLRRVAGFLGRLLPPDRARRPVGTVPGLARPPADRTEHRRRRDDGQPPPASAGSSDQRAHDYVGPVQVSYEPTADGLPDPGEVVWTWVPFEEDPSVGKDRPVLVLGFTVQEPTRELAVLMLSSRVHEDDPRWMVLGAGPWDAEGRASSVRLDRVLAVAAASVRREGGALDRRRFERVAGAVPQARAAH